MKTKIKVISHGIDLDSNGGVDWAEKIMKYEFWQEGKEPEDWQRFDGEITVHDESFGGCNNGAMITFNECDSQALWERVISRAFRAQKPKRIYK